MRVRVSVGVVVRGELERRAAVVVVRVVHADAIAVVHVAAEPLQLAAVTSTARALTTQSTTAHLHLSLDYYFTLLKSFIKIIAYVLQNYCLFGVVKLQETGRIRFNIQKMSSRQ